MIPTNSLHELKINDKVLCKRQLYLFGNKLGFKANHYYAILQLDKQDDTAWIVYGSDILNEGAWLRFQKNENNQAFQPFHFYFYTPQELRKMKLEQLSKVTMRPDYD